MGEQTEERRSAVVAFQVGTFGLDAIKKAAYRLSDRVTVDIQVGEVDLLCTLTPLLNIPAGNIDQIAEMFRLEVLDQDLRASIASETAAVRNAILAYAFSKTGLQGE